MALPLGLLNIHPLYIPLSISNAKPHHLATTSLLKRFQFPLTPHTIRYRGFKSSHFQNHTSSVPSPSIENDADVFGAFQNSLRYIQSILPGGMWWNLCDSNTQVTSNTANSVTLWAALRRMWNLLGNEHWVIYLAFASLVVAAVSDISMPRFLAESIFSAQAGDAVLFYRSARLLVLLCLTSGLSSGLRSCCFAIANVILVKRLRETLYSALIFQDISFFDTEEVGGLTSRLGADCQRLSHVLGNHIDLIARNTLQGAGALFNLLTLSWPLALSSIVTCSLLAIVLLVFGQYQKMAAKLTQDFTASANGVAEETFSLIRTIRVYGTERKEIGRYKEWLERIGFLSVRESAAHGFWSMSFNMLYRATQVFAVMLGGMTIMAGCVSTEQLTKYILYLEWLIYATWRLVDNVSSLLQATGASEKIFQLMQLSPSDQFLSNGLKLERFPVLQHLYLSVQENEVIALVGHSGCGKTTLVNLLLRLHEPSSGQIYIDGFPLKDLDIRWLRENIGYVGQEPKLFHMDVKSNITYGCHRDVQQEDIEWAAKQANAHEFISSLPEGYESLIDDDLLSGGQKQRIAIARAFLRNPAILILDEATSALDSESEHFVKGALHTFKNESKAKRTIIIIAHRLSTVKAADRIIVMDGGQIAEMGNHRELLLKGGLYSQLIKIQADFLG